VRETGEKPSLYHLAEPVNPGLELSRNAGVGFRRRRSLECFNNVGSKFLQAYLMLHHLGFCLSVLRVLDAGVNLSTVLVLETPMTRGRAISYQISAYASASMVEAVGT
jgi:hypothetical protein